MCTSYVQKVVRHMIIELEFHLFVQKSKILRLHNIKLNFFKKVDAINVIVYFTFFCIRFFKNKFYIIFKL